MLPRRLLPIKTVSLSRQVDFEVRDSNGKVTHIFPKLARDQCYYTECAPRFRAKREHLERFLRTFT